MTSDVSSRLKLAESIARQAGARAQDYFDKRDRLVIEEKRSVTDLVSEADKEVETLIREAIEAQFPSDGQIGEEHGYRRGQSSFTWVIDPIDGTAPFLSGLPGWCVSIGVLRDEKPVLGVIYAPVLNAFFSGGVDMGAKLNDEPIQVSEGDLRARMVGFGMNDRIPIEQACALITRLAQAGVNWTRYGSGALMLAYVSAGRLSGYTEPRMSIWDCCAAYAIIEAAGGKTLDFPSGTDWLQPAPVLAASPGAFDELLAISDYL